MNYSTAVILINPTIRTVRGQYEDNGNSAVFKTVDQDIKIADFAVVQSGTRLGITTIKVTEVDVSVDFDSSTQIGWVVQKIDMESHRKILEMETQAIEFIKKGELRKRREDIKKNTLDAISAGEIDSLEIARFGSPQLADSSSKE